MDMSRRFHEQQQPARGCPGAGDVRRQSCQRVEKGRADGMLKGPGEPSKEHQTGDRDRRTKTWRWPTDQGQPRAAKGWPHLRGHESDCSPVLIPLQAPPGLRMTPFTPLELNSGA